MLVTSFILDNEGLLLNSSLYSSHNPGSPTIVDSVIFLESQMQDISAISSSSLFTFITELLLLC